jgi:hypothetical protein
MSTRTPPPDSYTNVIHEFALDGGWSGQLRIVVGTNRVDQDTLVFVDSELLGARRLVLTPEEASAVGAALTKASIKAMRAGGSDMAAPRVRHRWEVDALPTEPDAPLTLWRDGEYVAHLDAVGAEGLANLLRARAEAVHAG